MITKTITLKLGGQERILLYGTVGYFEYIKEATGKDPFDWLDGLTKQAEGASLTVMVEDTATLVFAGLNCYADQQDQDNTPIDKVKKWTRALPVDTVQEIFKTLFATFATEEPGEVKALESGQQNGQKEETATVG